MLLLLIITRPPVILSEAKDLIPGANHVPSLQKNFNIAQNERYMSCIEQKYRFLHKYIAENIYRALWAASRRLGVRVLVRNKAGREQLEVVRR